MHDYYFMEVDFGFYTIDFGVLIDYFVSQPPLEIIGELFLLYGWVVFAWLLIYLGLFFLVDEYKGPKATKDWKWVLLAVDVPALNVQTPKAVEQMFSHLAGALDSPDIAAKYRHGFKQRWFSFEIISIEGYIQFLIWTEVEFRDLVEAAIYAQYPEADVVEVEDYVKAVPDNYPNDTHDVWAADFTLAEKSAYPIRTYREFEHSISKDTVLKDPMGTFLESFSRIGPGEQMWFQIIVQPVSNSWKEDAIKVVKEMIGEKPSAPKGSKVVDAIGDAPLKLLEGIGDQVFGREASVATSDSASEGPPNQLSYLTPGQSKLVEAIEEKISKIGFKTKMRGVYLATKETFRPTRGVNALIGAINQFNIPSANSIVPGYGVSASYFFKEKNIAKKKRLIMKAYKKRKMNVGANSFILNIEELATVWHFPMSHVKTPLVQKVADKAVEPPPGLPIESIGEEVVPTSLPTDLPLEGRTDTGVGFKPGQKFG